MKKWVPVIGIMFCLAYSLIGAEVVLPPDMDAHIRKGYPDSTFGGSTSMIIGAGGGPPYYISLIHFDLSSLMGSIVDQAVLRLYTLGGIEYYTGEVDIYRVAAPWEENTVTWNNQPLENRDINLVRALPPNSDSWFESSVGEIVQTWLEGSFPNHGFYLSVPDQGKQVIASIASKEHADPAWHPRLFVEYHNTSVTDRPSVPGVLCRISPISSGNVEISLGFPSPATASLKLYDACGSLVETLVERSLSSGSHSITWNGHPGVYFLLLTTPDRVITKKFIIVR